MDKKLNVDLHAPSASLVDWLISVSPGEKLPNHGMLCLEGDEEETWLYLNPKGIGIPMKI